jgi:hypothetical protein
MSGARKAAGSAALVLVDGAVPLRPGPALFEATLKGWRRQQAARRLTGPLIEGRIRLVRRYGEFTGAWPWQWTPGQVEDWITSGGWAHSTVRSYEGALAVFLSYVCDPRYGWIAECEQQVGARPVQVCHEGNTAVHAAEYEGRRPLARGPGLQPVLRRRDAAPGTLRILRAAAAAVLRPDRTLTPAPAAQACPPPAPAPIAAPKTSSMTAAGASAAACDGESRHCSPGPAGRPGRAGPVLEAICAARAPKSALNWLRRETGSAPQGARVAWPSSVEDPVTGRPGAPSFPGIVAEAGRVAGR